MKEQILATSDEIIVRDLYPLLVSNKRLYVVGGGNRKFKAYKTKKIIQLDKITAIRYQIEKNKGIKTFALLFLLLSFFAAGSLALIYFLQREIFDTLFVPLLCAFGGLVLISMILFIVYACKNNRVIYIEYPTNTTRPTRIHFKSVNNKDFNLFLSSLFDAIDSSSQTRVSTPSQKPSLIL